MNRRSRLAVLGMSLLGALLWAQGATILALRGDVQVEQNGSWAKATVGMKLQDNQKIKVGPQAYAALILANNKARELREPGTYTVGQLSAQVGKADNNPYAARYTGYVLNQAIASGAGRPSGKTLGAVTRSSMAPSPLTPAQSAFYAEKVLLQWDRVPGSEGYRIEILDEAGQVIHTEEIPADQHRIELNLASKVKPGTCYYWSISTRRYPTIKSNRLCFKSLPTDKAQSIKSEEQELLRTLDTQTALGQALLGAFYEQNGLYGYALQAYQQAAAYEPSTEGYVELRDGLGQRVVKNLTPVKE
mgnify:CR=1 FL=1